MMRGKHRPFAGALATFALLAAMVSPPSNPAAAHVKPEPEPAAEEGIFGPAPEGTELGEKESWELRREARTLVLGPLRPLCEPSADDRPDTVTFNFFPDLTIVAEASEVGRTDDGDGIHWSGGVADHPDSSVTFTALNLCTGGKAPVSLAGSVGLNGHEVTIEPRDDGSVVVTEIDTTAAGLLQKPGDPKQERHVCASWRREKNTVRSASPRPGQDGAEPSSGTDEPSTGTDEPSSGTDEPSPGDAEPRRGEDQTAPQPEPGDEPDPAACPEIGTPPAGENEQEPGEGEQESDEDEDSTPAPEDRPGSPEDEPGSAEDEPDPAEDQPDAAERAVRKFPVIDVAILYTPGAVSQAHGRTGIRGWIHDAASRANRSLAKSRINAKFRIVALAKAKYSGKETVSPAFNRLNKTRDPLRKQAAALRAKSGADVVTVVVKGYSPKDGIAGLASYPEKPRRATTSDEVWSVVAANQLWAYVLAHEWGHLLGQDHDWRTSPEKNPYYPDNHGYYAPDSKFVTIMGYPTACKRMCQYAGYFANPGLKLHGRKLGTAMGKGGRPANNARVMNITAPQVAAYRQPKGPKAAAPVYNLTTSADPVQGGQVNAGGSAPFGAGAAVSVSAQAADGHVFTGWTLNGKPAGKSDPIRITMDRDVALVGHFAKRKGGTRYTISHRTAPEDGGEVSLDPPGPSFREGTQVTATAKPRKGYAFTGWKVDGHTGGEDTQLTLDLSRDRSITAQFTPAKLKLDTEASPEEGGAVTLEQDGPYAAGDEILAHARPDKGYQFDHWELDGQRIGSEPATNVTISKDQRLTAHFVKETVAITGISPARGKPGDLVKISGTHLFGASDLVFGGVRPKKFTVGTSDAEEEDDVITVRVPDHDPGPVRVVVTTPAGVTKPVTFTYTG